jgi:hypothetical protein
LRNTLFADAWRSQACPLGNGRSAAVPLQRLASETLDEPLARLHIVDERGSVAKRGGFLDVEPRVAPTRGFDPHKAGELRPTPASRRPPVSIFSCGLQGTIR